MFLTISVFTTKKLDSAIRIFDYLRSFLKRVCSEIIFLGLFGKLVAAKLLVLLKFSFLQFIYLFLCHGVKKRDSPVIIGEQHLRTSQRCRTATVDHEQMSEKDMKDLISRVVQNQWNHKLMATILSVLNRFSFFTGRFLGKFAVKSLLKNCTTVCICCHTTLWNINVRKQAINDKLQGSVV